MNWIKGMFGLSTDAPEAKDIVPWGRQLASTENSDNFTRNQVSLSDFNDALVFRGRNALGLSATWACINLLAGTIASLPIVVYQQVNGIKQVARDNPLYWLLHDSPNFDDSAVDFWEFMCASIELHGNAYAEIKRNSLGVVTSLLPIRPDLVSVKRNPQGEIEYTWTSTGQSFKSRDVDMLHIRGPLGDALSGVSTLSVCSGAFRSALAADNASQIIFQNGIQSTGVFTTDPSISLTKEQRLELDDYMRDRYMGARNQGRPMLLDRGMKFQQLDLTPEDAQMIETRGFSVEEICRIFGVPPHMVGHTSSSTSWGTGLEQQTLGFVKFSLQRRIKRIEQSLEKQLLTKAQQQSGLSIEFNLEGLLRGDSAGRSAFYKVMTDMGAMTINEVRALENLPPLPGGDVARTQMQNAPIDGSGQEDSNVT
jgi:HK97 family phage portal protein